MFDPNSDAYALNFQCVDHVWNLSAKSDTGRGVKTHETQTRSWHVIRDGRILTLNWTADVRWFTVHAAPALFACAELSTSINRSESPRTRSYNIGQMLVIWRSRFISFSTEIASRVLGIDLRLTSNVNLRGCVILDTNTPSNNSIPDVTSACPNK